MKLLLICIARLLSHAELVKGSFSTKCLAFQPQNSIYNATLSVREYVSTGTTITLADNDKSCATPNQIVSANLCRIALHVPTSDRSSITMELWLPEVWQGGRVLATGNGGIDGCIDYASLAYGSQHGFVTVGANNGHNGTGGQDFLNNPDIIMDFAWRSLHTSIAQAKSLSTKFYDTNYQKSYYIGCSLGGRQGIGAADRFPGDFDGIIAGSPAVDFNHLYAWRASFYPITGNDTSTNFINASLWSTIHDEVLRQCDTLDGVRDGIIEDSSLCLFRPEALLCSKGNTTNCLEPAQIGIVNRIYSPFYGTNGQLIFPAMQPGNELLAAGGLYSGHPWQLSQDWYRYVLLNNSDWDQATFNLADAMLADEVNPSNIRTWPTSLQPFSDRGGKLLTFHGGQDQQITSYNSPRFYNHLARSMDASSSVLDGFYRFFRVSGMGHCGQGPGAWAFGQLGGIPTTSVPFQPETNALAAIVHWVEMNEAPETILGTKFVNDDPQMGIAFQRRHCRYPRRNTYLGGSASNPNNWQCRYV